MSQVVTLDLPEHLLERAKAVAAQTHRRLEDVLIEWLSLGAAELPVAQLSDEQVLALRDSEMRADDQQELSDLLAQQREGVIATPDRQRLDALLATYRRGMVRKAEALRVAVDRGLQPPLS